MNNTGWHIEAVGHVADVFMGQAPDGETVKKNGKGLPFLQGNADFGKRHPSTRLTCSHPPRVCEKGDLLVSVRAPVGEINLADQRYAIGRGLAAVRFRKIDPKFGRWALEYCVTQLKRVSQGTTFEAIGRKDLQHLGINVPSHPAEQQRIAEILDTLDGIVDNQARTISKLDAVYAGLREALLSSLAAARKSQVRSIFDVKAGITLGPDRKPLARPRAYLRVANVQRGEIDLSDVAQMECSKAEASLYGLAEGDLLIVEGHANPDEIGRCAMVGGAAVGMVYQNHLFRLRSDSVLPKFGELWLNSATVRSYWRRMCATSSGLYTINSKMLGMVEFPDIEIEEQARLARPLVSMEDRLGREKFFMEKLKILRKGISEDLLTGRVRVSEAEAVVENL